VRDLWIRAEGTEEEALLLCCGLVQLGYKHRVYLDLSESDVNLSESDAHLTESDEPAWPPSAWACMGAILCAAGMNADVQDNYYLCAWRPMCLLLLSKRAGPTEDFSLLLNRLLEAFGLGEFFSLKKVLRVEDSLRYG
jgi:hypothetical protein